jgi:hypothetical protein
MKNNCVDPKMIQVSLEYYCMEHGGPKDCSGILHSISCKLYDDNGNELTNKNSYRYTSKIYSKYKCDKCGHETFIIFNPYMPTIM